jgi:hypothetical protein
LFLLLSPSTTVSILKHQNMADRRGLYEDFAAVEKEKQDYEAIAALVLETETKFTIDDS